MRVLITTAQVPFVHGGAEIHAESLRDAIRRAGHESAIAAIPFKWYPPERILDHMLACRLLDVTEVMGTRVDRVIGLKFPAYLIPHPDKVLWVLHQYRDAYDLWQRQMGALHRYPNGAQVRDAIRHADRRLIPEAKKVFANSRNVARRLLTHCGVSSTPLYHPPPHAESFYSAAAGDYVLFPSRLTPIKRQELVLEALAKTRHPVHVRFAGAADHPPYAGRLQERAVHLGVSGQVTWLGKINEDQKRFQYAHALAVLYPPEDEDYGYVTLEAMLASKPVVTCTDSGGPLEFVRPGETGLVAEPTAASLANAMDEIWECRDEAERWGRAARDHHAALNITWPHVVSELLA